MWAAAGGGGGDYDHQERRQSVLNEILWLEVGEWKPIWRIWRREVGESGNEEEAYSLILPCDWDCVCVCVCKLESWNYLLEVPVISLFSFYTFLLQISNKLKSVSYESRRAALSIFFATFAIFIIFFFRPARKMQVAWYTCETLLSLKKGQHYYENWCWR